MKKTIYSINRLEYERLLEVCKTRREMQNISKSKMAEMCGVTRQTIFNFENNIGALNITLLNLYGMILDSVEIKVTMSESLYNKVEIEV